MFDFDEKQLRKLEDMRGEGKNPFPSGASVDDDLAERLSTIREWSSYTLSKSPQLPLITFAGRLRFKNELGNMGFARLDFQGETLQICVRKNGLDDREEFKDWKKLDVGDWVLVTGNFMRTRMGELSIDASSIQLYSKCMMGMPDKLKGLTDPESRQRMRYLDLIVNQASRETFEARFGIIKYIRRYLEDEGFVEVETPILQTIPGGASARPFETHHNALDTELYMRIAPELYLKRLVVGGFERVFEIGKNFRNEGLSPKHNPEFTMVEFYQAHATYLDLIKMTQNLIVGLVGSIFDSFLVPYGDRVIDFSAWGTCRFDELIEKVGVRDAWSLDSLRSFLNTDDGTLSELQQVVFDKYIEPQLINPTFVTHYPIELSPLARRSDDDPRVTDRFELFINGFEIANGFSELNDPVDQAERFAEQVNRKSQGDDEAMYFDEDYVRALAYGMPPTAGEGIGIDRLVMLLTNSETIRDVILFPTRKNKQEFK